MTARRDRRSGRTAAICHVLAGPQSMVGDETRSNPTAVPQPRHSRKDAPCSSWSFRSSIAAQIHMAGSIWTKVSRQLDKSSRRPWKSMARRPPRAPAAQLDDGGLHHGVVAVADRPDELPGMSPKAPSGRLRRRSRCRGADRGHILAGAVGRGRCSLHLLIPAWQPGPPFLPPRILAASATVRPHSGKAARTVPATPPGVLAPPCR